MNLRCTTRGAAIVLFAATMMPPGTPAKPGNAAKQDAAAGPQTTVTLASPETADGLKNLLQNWLAAVESGNSEKSDKFLQSFAIPNHAAWFAKTFGDAEGPRLETTYTQLQAKDPNWLAATGVRSVQAERLVVQVSAFANPADTQIALLKAALTAEKQATPIYYVRTFKTTSEPGSNFLGCFVYIDGGFRHLDPRVLQALSSTPAKPASITVGGSVQAARLIKRVPPEYPEKARKLMVEGVVKLHAIIAQDGTVRELRVMDGQPLLNQAALEAVKQWRYQPTMLLGKPVEVDTEIDVVFQLRR